MGVDADGSSKKDKEPKNQAECNWTTISVAPKHGFEDQRLLGFAKNRVGSGWVGSRAKVLSGLKKKHTRNMN